MPRRIHLTEVVTGEIALSERESHHLRHVLRLLPGAPVEVFDDAGRIGHGMLREASKGTLAVVVSEVVATGQVEETRLTIAGAVPKSGRADWMIEKLSELGVKAYIPLSTERSVVMPEGKNKIQRWERLAVEAAKQSHRSGVLHIHSPLALDQAITAAQGTGHSFCLSTAEDAVPIRRALAQCGSGPITMFVGPEGGWSPRELVCFLEAGIAPVSLTRTILRIETAAIACAAAVLID